MVPPPRASGVVFVTGAGGFIGRHVTSAFRAAGWTVAGFGPPPRFDDVPALLAPHHRFEGRLSREALSEAASLFGLPEVVVHAAGAGSVGPSLADPGRDYARNVGSLEPVLTFLRQTEPPMRLVYLSSAAVYGAGHAGPIQESATVAPISPYGHNKRRAEEMVMSARRDGSLDAVILRLFSVYGPGLRKQLPWDIVTRLRAGETPLRLGGTGEEQRDFLHVEDAVGLIGCVLGAKRPAAILNGGAGAPVTVTEFASLLCIAAGSTASPVFDGRCRLGDPASLVADIAAVRQLGFAPQTPLSEGVRAFHAWAQRASA